MTRYKLGERVDDADDGHPELFVFHTIALHKLLAPAIRRPVIVTALLRLFLIFFYFVQ